PNECFFVFEALLQGTHGRWTDLAQRLAGGLPHFPVDVPFQCSCQRGHGVLRRDPEIAQFLCGAQAGIAVLALQGFDPTDEPVIAFLGEPWTGQAQHSQTPQDEQTSSHLCTSPAKRVANRSDELECESTGPSGYERGPSLSIVNARMLRRGAKKNDGGRDEQIQRNDRTATPMSILSNLPPSLTSRSDSIVPSVRSTVR